jgi:hypothetical protein
MQLLMRNAELADAHAAINEGEARRLDEARAAVDHVRDAAAAAKAHEGELSAAHARSAALEVELADAVLRLSLLAPEAGGSAAAARVKKGRKDRAPAADSTGAELAEAEKERLGGVLRDTLGRSWPLATQRSMLQRSTPCCNDRRVQPLPPARPTPSVFLSGGSSAPDSAPNAAG